METGKGFSRATTFLLVYLLTEKKSEALKLSTKMKKVHAHICLEQKNNKQPSMHFTFSDEEFKNIGKFVEVMQPVFDVFTSLKLNVDVEAKRRICGAGYLLKLKENKGFSATEIRDAMGLDTYSSFHQMAPQYCLLIQSQLEGEGYEPIFGNCFTCTEPGENEVTSVYQLALSRSF